MLLYYSTMIPLSEYIKKNSWTVAGSKSSKLLVFDVDDTLINTSARIFVRRGDKLVKTLTNNEYNTYKLRPGEWFDYSEFADPEILSKETFTKYWDTLKREYKKGTHISIITARGDANMIREFFLKNGIDIKQELVFAVGDKNYMYHGTVAERKAKTIKLLADLGYRTLIFFDDNEENLKAVKKLENDELNIHTVKA